MSRTIRPGPHELGQNLLTNQRIARQIAESVAGRPGPLVEWAAGRGAITAHLARLGRPVEAVEIDPRSVSHLRRTLGRRVTITHADLLRHRLPPVPHDLVANLPFHVTTAALRRLLRTPYWRRAVLVTQWEVARKRAAVGGATLLTAQAWPWFEFELLARVPAHCFRPRPGIDAGLLRIDRRAEPLIAARDAERYRRFTARAFREGGSSLKSSLIAAGVPRQRLGDWLARQRHPRPTRLRQLGAEGWVELFALAGGTAVPTGSAAVPPRQSRRSPRRGARR